MVIEMASGCITQEYIHVCLESNVVRASVCECVCALTNECDISCFHSVVQVSCCCCYVVNLKTNVRNISLSCLWWKFSEALVCEMK